MDDIMLAAALHDLGPEVLRALDRAHLPGASPFGDGRSRSPKRTFTLGLEECRHIKAIDVSDVWPRFNLRRDGHCLRERLRALASTHLWFYVGVSRYLSQRWLGTPNWHWSAPSVGFPGHRRALGPNGRRLWETMIVLLYMPAGISVVEAAIVDWCSSSTRCRNAASGGGHYNPHSPGFLYILLSCAPASSTSPALPTSSCGPVSTSRRAGAIDNEVVVIEDGDSDEEIIVIGASKTARGDKIGSPGSLARTPLESPSTEALCDRNGSTGSMARAPLESQSTEAPRDRSRSLGSRARLRGSGSVREAGHERSDSSGPTDNADKPAVRSVWSRAIPTALPASHVGVHLAAP